MHRVPSRSSSVARCRTPAWLTGEESDRTSVCQEWLRSAGYKQGWGSFRRRRSGTEEIWGRGINVFLVSFSGLSSLVFKRLFLANQEERVFPGSDLGFQTLSCDFIIVGHSSPSGILISLWNPSWALLRWFISTLLACCGSDYLAIPSTERNTFQGWKTFLHNNRTTLPKALG